MQISTQIFRNSWTMSDTMRAIMKNNPGLYGSVANTKKEAFDQHMFAIEAWLLFGAYDAMSMNGQPFNLAPGFRDWTVLAAPQNIITIATEMDYEDLFNVLEYFGRTMLKGANSKNKVLYVDSQALTAINRLGRAYHNMRVESGTDTFGKRYASIVTDTLNITVYHHDFLDTLENAAGIGIVIDYSVLKIRYLKGRKTFFEEFNIDASGNRSKVNVENGMDGGGGSWITELLLENYNPAAGGFIFGLNSSRCKLDCKQ